MKHRANRVLSTIAITIALVSLPISIGISGRARNDQNHQLCLYSLHQWHASDRTIVRFTRPHSAERTDALEILGPKPRC